MNDAGSQVELLGAGRSAPRLREAAGEAARLPRGRLPGRVRARARRRARRRRRSARRSPARRGSPRSREPALERMLAGQRARSRALRRGLRPLVPRVGAPQPGALERALAALDRVRPRGRAGGRQAGSRARAFGDDKDRVVVRRNGIPTYLLADIAYHGDKHARGFARVIDLWGPDHHGHIRAHAGGGAGARARRRLPRGADRPAGEPAVAAASR